MTVPQLHKETESDDPYALVGQRYQSEPGVDPDAAMARCFVEEFALIGFRPERILRLFQLATYAGVYEIYTRKGDAFVREIIEDVFQQPLSPVLDVLAEEEAI